MDCNWGKQICGISHRLRICASAEADGTSVFIVQVSSALPVRHAQKPNPVQYIRYTPSQQGSGHNSGAQQRIIRMVEVQQDPMEPPKFKYVIVVVTWLIRDWKLLSDPKTFEFNEKQSCFRINQKIPRAPPSPPAPVMHSPPRKVFVFIFVLLNHLAQFLF